MDSKPDPKKAQEYQRKCLSIVQKYIDPITRFDPGSFLYDCHFMTRAHYDDLIEERSCTDLCGYVPCSKPLSQTSGKSFTTQQKYHIKNNRVFDITRRRNYCSDRCFKSSEFLRDQIFTEPLFLRKTADLEKRPELYKDSKGQIGDEVDIGLPISVQDITEIVTKPPTEEKQTKKSKKPGNKPLTKKDILRNEKSIENRISAPYAKEEDLKQLRNEFQTFEIKERTFDENMVEISSAGERPIRSQNTDSTAKKQTEQPKTKDQILDELIQKMSQWFTEETAKFLNIQPKPFKMPEPMILDDEDPQKKMERYRWEYIRLCAKLDKEELEDQKWDEAALKEKKKKNRRSVRFKDEEEEKDDQELVKSEKCEDAEPKPNNAGDHLFLPLNENHHANIKRRRIFLIDIDRSLSTLFPTLDGFELHDQIKSLIRTFRLESSTTVVGQRINLLVAMILVRILMKCNIIDPDRYNVLFDQSNRPLANILAEFDLTIPEIDCVVQKLLQ